MNRLDIVTTISASRVTPRWLKGLKNEGTTFFRINGAFESLRGIKSMVRSIRKALGVHAPILLDIPRNKIRLAQKRYPSFKKGGAVRLGLNDVNFPHFFAQIKNGDVLYAKDSKFRFVVEKRSSDSATLIAEQDGTPSPGMGLHRLGGWDGLPLFSSRDEELLKISREHEIPYLGISYLRHAKEISEIRRAIGKSLPIFKIETYHAFHEMSEILKQIETISVDRGDLSSEIGIENIHAAQQQIIQQAKRNGNRVFLATQFLQNMVLNPLPSISEVTSMHEAFEDGIDGIQLSEETARGAFALESVRWVKSLFSTWSNQAENGNLRPLEGSVIWLTGLSGSGKTTLAGLLEKRLGDLGHRVVLLDGDDVRSFFDGAFSYEKKDRILNQKNLIFLSKKLAEHGAAVIVSSLSPYVEMRELARTRIPRFIEIYVKCSIDECRRRDPKGLYAGVNTGSVRTPFVGINEAYEPPHRPNYVVDTESKDTARCFEDLVSFLGTMRWDSKSTTVGSTSCSVSV